MNTLYLITGASGHLGSVLTEKLLADGKNVRALVLPGEEDLLPEGAEAFTGDVTDKPSLSGFFWRPKDTELVLLHCAGRITIASRPDPMVHKINVGGTRNVLECARDARVDRVIYVSSVHAIPERKKGTVIREVEAFSPADVQGQYAKSKAAASQLVLDFAKRGMNASIVHPSGIIGPGDSLLQNHSVRTIRAMAEGKFHTVVPGGYDFVDSRDVADGILACVRRGRQGECYLLSGHYITVRQMMDLARGCAGKRPLNMVLPYRLAEFVAPAGEKVARACLKRPSLLTPYSLKTLQTNGKFSHEKATLELGYHPRPIEESIRDTILE